MQAPRLKSMFRNVRTDPRRFEFKSRHLPDLDGKWRDRKEQVEKVVTAANHEKAETKAIRFRARGTSYNSDRLEARKEQLSAARLSMLRAGMIAAVLIWLAWKGIQWVEQSDFSRVLKWMENA